MSDSRIEQLEKLVIAALDGVTNVNNVLIKQANQIGTLADALDNARNEKIIIAKVVGWILGRECLSSQDPHQRLEHLLSPLLVAAEIFADSADLEAKNARYLELDLPPPDYTKEEKQDAKDAATIAANYQSTANQLREEAMKVISASIRPNT